ncbi:uncharacterized protein LOC134215856 [Armigeres subalbatus]|uniref:uncharacterized protein LOC134215856 n=1 Tax=Armigeres subalbatus TaxID=124917 RepID=UPI002ED24D71
MIGMCPNNMKFNDTIGRCIPRVDESRYTIRIYDESENCGIMIPDCNKDGKFPVPANCSFYYDCQRNNHNYLQYVYKCPCETMYHPDLHRCVPMTNCYVDHYAMFDRFDDEFFPKCVLQGQFRTSRNCNLYYRCVPNMDGSFFQIRYECPAMMFYNIELERCQTKYLTNCDYIPWRTIVKNYALKHDLSCDHCEPLYTTSISTLNTTISTNGPCTCSPTTECFRSTTVPMFDTTNGTSSTPEGTTDPTDITSTFFRTRSDTEDISQTETYTNSISTTDSGATITDTTHPTDEIENPEVTSSVESSTTDPDERTTSAQYSTHSSSEDYDSYEIFTWDDRSWRRTKTPPAFPSQATAFKKNGTLDQPVRCVNNRQGGLTCDGVEGNPNGWIEIPGYSIRYQRRVGNGDKPNKQLNADVNLRLRYPQMYRFEAYPKRRKVEVINS